MYHVSGSDAISRDMNSVLFSSTFKLPSEGEFAKIKQLIASDPTPNYHHQSPLQTQPVPPPTTQQQQQQQSSLLRYRSAPSTLFANLIDGTTGDDGENECDDFLNSLSSSSAEPVSKRFFTDESRDLSRFPTILKQEERDSFPPPQNQQEDYVMYGNNSRAVDLPNHSSGLNVESSFRVGNSTSSNLIRQSSSPAGFLSSLNVENGISVMRDVGTPSSSSRLINHINFSTGPSSGSRFLPQITENGHEIIGLGSPETGHMVNGDDVNRGYDPSTHNDSWNDSAFNSLKRDRNGDLKMYSGLNGFDTQNGDSKSYTPSLVHHLSLPKTSSEMAAVEKFLQFQQESVPCKIRAKRGYATHPRSIAERVRRTRISERMRKLQELFPNMDKQTNTADMLDLAVEYIKDLQKEVKTLTDTRAKCTCLRTEKLSSIPTE